MFSEGAERCWGERGYGLYGLKLFKKVCGCFDLRSLFCTFVNITTI